MRSIWPRLKSPAGIFMLVAAAVGGYYLLTEHFTHVAQTVPYLFLLACPLMHVFGHGHAHGTHGQHGRGASSEDDRAAP
jgi:hypothetical protein